MAFEHQRAHVLAGYQKGVSFKDSFATLLPEAHIEVVGPADWGDDASGIGRR